MPPRRAFLGVTLAALAACLGLATAAGAQSGPVSWPLGTYANRQFIRVQIQNARCGGGAPYSIFFSSGPREVDGQLNRRVVIWLPGGGSTSLDLNGALDTPIRNLAEVRNRLTAPTSPGATRMLFFQHASNDAYIGQAHWAIFPYCTQDFHSGRMTQPIAYDFTGVASLRREVESRVNGGTTPAALEAQYPGLDIEGQQAGGSFSVTHLTIRIEHRGALDFEAGFQALRFILAAQGVDIRRGDVTIAGSSAGGFGAWYNARLVGDLLWPQRDERGPSGKRLARLTVVPMSGSPTEKVWDDAAQGLVTDPAQVAALDHRLDVHAVTRPCSVAGGAYVPTPGVQCDDTLDLARHYLKRWKGLNLRIAPVVNKEDAIGVRGFAGTPGQAGYGDRLLRFCKTVTRYTQESALISRRITPWTDWMWHNLPKATSPLVLTPVHGFEFATELVPMLQPDPAGGPWHPTLLEWINAVADRDRRLRQTSFQIERQLGLVENAYDPSTKKSPYQPQDGVPLSQRAACNVPWPAG